MKRPILSLLALALSLPAFACQIIIEPPPRPAPTPLQPMQVRNHAVDVRLTERFAEVTVQATFYNPNGQRIEGTYLFPIAPEAAVSSFAMTVNGKTMEAELLPADKARGIYENIVRQMRDPALLEYLEQGLLKARVFPIEPRSDVRVTLTYEQQIPRDSGIARFVYPLLSARPGGNGQLATVDINVNLTTSKPIQTLYAPGFDAQIKRDGQSQATISWKATNYVPSKDFEIVLSTGTRAVGSDLLAYKKGDDGYFMLFLSPDSELQAESIAAKDIIFVIDTSGSMNGTKIKQARQALRYCVDNLAENDRFNIVSFATDVQPLAREPLAADEASLSKARHFIDAMNARGGTAIDDALAFALAQPTREDAVPMIVFLTDGLPTIGEVEPAAIRKRVDAKQVPRIFTFGVGDDVHTTLLDGIAAASSGYTTYVRPGQDLELALTSFFEKIASPVMTDLQLETDGVELSQMMPGELPDLFRGDQVTIVGRYQGSGTKSFMLSGRVGDHRENFRFDADLDGNLRNSFIPRLWAIRRVAHLHDAIRLNGESKELVDEIKRLGREFGIVTPYTSFLVVEEGMAVREREGARQELDRLMEKQASAPSSGRSAVDAASSIQEMKAAEAPTANAAITYGMVAESEATHNALRPERLREIVRTAGDTTFYFRHQEKTWYDAAIPAGTQPDLARTVKAWSPEFFALLRQSPELRQYLQVGLPIVIELADGSLVRIED